MIENFEKLIPKSQRKRSGKAFYSGRRAFEAQSDLYIIGLNPGGKPKDYQKETVRRHTRGVLHNKPTNWSAYKDEAWGNQAKGEDVHQRRVRYLFRKLKLNARKVPASNLIFPRSQSKKKLKGDFKELACECWPFHEAVIKQLEVRVVVCLGKDVGKWVCDHLDARAPIDEFVEIYPKRRWKSHTHKNASGLTVVTLTHPSNADWTNPNADPTGLVVNALNKTRRRRRRQPNLL